MTGSRQTSTNPYFYESIPPRIHASTNPYLHPSITPPLHPSTLPYLHVSIPPPFHQNAKSLKRKLSLLNRRGIDENGNFSPIKLWSHLPPHMQKVSHLCDSKYGSTY